MENSLNLTQKVGIKFVLDKQRQLHALRQEWLADTDDLVAWDQYKELRDKLDDVLESIGYEEL